MSRLQRTREYEWEMLIPSYIINCHAAAPRPHPRTAPAPKVLLTAKLKVCHIPFNSVQLGIVIYHLFGVIILLDPTRATKCLIPPNRMYSFSVTPINGCYACLPKLPSKKSQIQN